MTVTERESGRPPRPGRKKYDLKGKKLFENPETSSDEESPPPSESEDAAEEDDDEDDNTPLFHVRQTMRRSAVSTSKPQSRPSPAVEVPAPDLTQATPAEITRSPEALQEQDRLDSIEASSPEEPLIAGSATEEQLPVMQLGGLERNTTLISGESNQVRIQLSKLPQLIGRNVLFYGVSLTPVKILTICCDCRYGRRLE